MASIAKEANGRRTIQFIGRDGKRHSVRLGKVPQKMAESVKLKIEHLVAAAETGHALDSETARWVAELGDDLSAKLSRAGLIPERETAKLGEFLTSYIKGRADAKPASRVVWRHTQNNLVTFLGEGRVLRNITPADAEGFRQYLIGEKLASTTIAKRLQFARGFFSAMLKRKLIGANPFAEVRHQAGDVTTRQRFIDTEATTALLEAAPSTDWRTIIALARWAGLRCPSEVLSLRWDGIDWARNRMRVDSPKTEHHAGKAFRWVPIFPELRPYLDAAWEAAEPGAEYAVGGDYRQAALGPNGWVNCNLRTTMERIVKRAGLEPWPRLFHNLRASRETELAARFPLHVVSGWLGHTTTIAAKHYLQTTEADFARAASEVVQNPVQSTPDLHRVVQKAVQPASATVRQETTEPQASVGVRPSVTSHGGGRQSRKVEDRGLEPLTFWLPARRSPN